MVEFVFSSSFYWYFIHGSIMYITHLKRYSKTMYEVEINTGGGYNFNVVFFSKLRKIWIRVSGYKATKSAKVCKIKNTFTTELGFFVLTFVVFSMNS